MQSVVQTIETYFDTYWTYCEVNYSDPLFVNSEVKWLELIIAPVVSETNCISTGTTKEVYQIQVTGLSINSKVEAGKVMDTAITFLHRKLINGVLIGNWSAIAQGALDNGTYFYKIAFRAETR